MRLKEPPAEIDFSETEWMHATTDGEVIIMKAHQETTAKVNRFYAR